MAGPAAGISRVASLFEAINDKHVLVFAYTDLRICVFQHDLFIIFMYPPSLTSSLRHPVRASKHVMGCVYEHAT